MKANPELASALDRHFASFVARFGGDEARISLAAAALSKAVRGGHICLTLESIAAANAPGLSAAQWRDELRKSAAVGGPAEETPLVLDSADRLYLRRYWNYQTRVAVSLRERCSRNPRFGSTPSLATQKDAIAAALRNELTIICGGPGTGKTSTVGRILERLLAEDQTLRIALAAPTGKAAARLEEALRAGASGELKMPAEAKTIHRLLGRKSRGTGFRHDAQNLLPLDVLVVDETSMVALPLLARLFDALPPRCRVILLGDRDQLASVEPGAVLAEIVDAATSAASPLRGSVVTLQKNYRFDPESGVAQACSAVRRGDPEGLLALLTGPRPADLAATEVADAATLHEWLLPRVTAGFAGLAREPNPGLALSKLKQFRVLTPLRQGLWGVAGLNRAIEKALLAATLIPASAGNTYAGKPILISQNDYELDLYNGDHGLLLPDPAAAPGDDTLYAWFLGKENNVRRIAQARLPAHETAYAMTVHKAQGSEFERVLFVLPEADSPLLTRELLYTALTRARTALDLCWNAPVLRAAVARLAQRESGLRDLLAAPAEWVQLSFPLSEKHRFPA